MIYVIVPFHNDSNRLKDFVVCLNRQTVKPFVVWVDCGSTDDSTFQAIRYVGRAKHLRISSRNYWAGALKAGQEWVVSHAKDTDVVGVMNNDVRFDDSLFVYILPSPNALTSLETHSERGITVDWSKFKFRRVWLGPDHCFENRAVFLTVANFRKVKFHPWLLPHYASDYHWTMKAIEGGLSPVVLCYTKVLVNRETTGIQEPKSIREIFSIRYGGNPWFNSAFIALCCPWKYKIQNVVRVWGYAIIRMIRLFKNNNT